MQWFSVLSFVIFLKSIACQVEERIIRKNFLEDNAALKFIQNYDSNGPVALVVDETQESIEDAQIFFSNFQVLKEYRNRFRVYQFNSSGASKSGLEPEVLKKLSTENLDFDVGETTLTYFASLQAMTMLNKGGALVVFVARRSSDEYLAHQAVLYANAKNLRIYVVWGGVYPTAEGEDRLLKEMCSETKGLFLLTDRSFDNPQNDQNSTVLMHKVNVTRPQDFTFLVPKDLKGLHFVIAPAPQVAHVTTSEREELDLANDLSVMRFSPKSFSYRANGSAYQEAHLFLNGTTQNASKQWHLNFKPLKDERHNITVYGISQEILRENANLKTSAYYFDGPVGRYGQVFPKPPLSIEVGPDANLIGTPGTFPELYFEVTNNGLSAVDVRFTCSDEKYLLYTMYPYRKVIRPSETATVRVTLNVNKPGSYTNQLTFSAIGGITTVSKRVLVDIGDSLSREGRPVISTKYLSDCTDILLKKCEEAVWTVEVKAQDSHSGLQYLSTSPKGLFFPNGFTAGTREEVTGYYSESCCFPKAHIVASNRHHHSETKTINAYYAMWSSGAISALVLGIILLLILVIALCCLWSKRKENFKYDLPIFRGLYSSWSSSSCFEMMQV